MSTTTDLERYRHISALGHGGMSTVMLAEDTLLGRRVALKRLHATEDTRGLSRLRREALIGASLSHPNLVPIYDIVTVEEGEQVIVMEYVEGETLRDAVRRGGRLEVARALRILEGVAAGLDAIHAQGIVHRDVKPANILLGRDGSVKLADLGVASAPDRTRITTEGGVVGTFSYMAPEQLGGTRATPAADIYALAAVAFEALSGRKARNEPNPLALAHAIATSPPPDLRAAWPDAPAAAAKLLTRGMSRKPGDRPRSAGELVARLRQALVPDVTEAGAVAVAPGSAPAAQAPAPARAKPKPAPARAAKPKPAPARAAKPKSALAPAPAPASRRPRPARPPERPAPAADARPSDRRRRGLILAAAIVPLLVVAAAIAAIASGGGGGSKPAAHAIRRHAYPRRREHVEAEAGSGYVFGSAEDERFVILQRIELDQRGLVHRRRRRGRGAQLGRSRERQLGRSCGRGRALLHARRRARLRLGLGARRSRLPAPAPRLLRLPVDVLRQPLDLVRLRAHGQPVGFRRHRGRADDLGPHRRHAALLGNGAARPRWRGLAASPDRHRVPLSPPAR